MIILEQFIDCMQQGNIVALVDLFSKYGVLHDPPVMRAGMDTIHLEGETVMETMFRHKFGFNGGPSLIKGIRYKGDNTVWYFTIYNDHMVPVTASLSEVDDKGKIRQLNIYPL